MGFWLAGKWVKDDALRWYYAQRKSDRIRRLLCRISAQRALQYDEAGALIDRWMSKWHSSNLGRSSTKRSLLPRDRCATLINGKWRGLMWCRLWWQYADEATAERREWYYLDGRIGFVRWETRRKQQKRINSRLADLGECKKLINQLQKESRNGNNHHGKTQEATL